MGSFDITFVDDCTNDAGFKCKFPFEYKGLKYYKCTKKYSPLPPTPWCYDVRGIGPNGKRWDYCSNCKGMYSILVNQNPTNLF